MTEAAWQTLDAATPYIVSIALAMFASVEVIRFFTSQKSGRGRNKRFIRAP